MIDRLELISGLDEIYNWLLLDSLLIKISSVMRLSRKFVSEIQAIIEACYQGLMVTKTTLRASHSSAIRLAVLRIRTLGVEDDWQSG